MRIFLALLLIPVLFSCGERPDSGVLSQKKMTNMLLEIHLIDAQLSTIHIDSARRVIDSYYQQVFQNFDTDSATFNRSIAYYTENPIQMTTIYEDLNQQLATMDKEYNRIDSLRQALVTDSVNRVNRLKRLANQSKNLILSADRDAICIPYSYYNEQFMKQAELEYFIPKPPAPAMPEPVPVKEEAIIPLVDAANQLSKPVTR